MQTRFIRNLILVVLLTTVGIAYPAIVSRIVTFTDGTVLTAADLNSEFNNLVNNINALDNDNISATANISPSKLSATIAGDGIGRDSGTGVLEVNDDNSTLEINADTLRVKDNGITDAKLRQSAGLSVVGRSANTTGNVADMTASSDGDVLRRSGTTVGFGALGSNTVGSAQITDASIATADIADGAVTQAKRAALGQQVSSELSSQTITTLGSDVDLTNLSVSITTSGRPVYIGFVCTNAAGNPCYFDLYDSSGTSCSASIKFKRDGSLISEQEYTIGSITGATQVRGNISPTAFRHIDVVAAGTYAYKATVNVDTGCTSMNVRYTKLIAFEL